jgi:hypothetical protein
MDEAVADCGATFEANVFPGHFNDLRDPRQRGKVIDCTPTPCADTYLNTL